MSARVIGLTGGIASGKSTVHQMLAALGAAFVDADAVYHDLIAPLANQPSPLARAVGQRFPGVLTHDGRVDRRRLGERVFTHPDERRALEALTHPAVAAESKRRIAALADGGAPVVIYDVPLLYERGLEGGVAGVIVVWVPEAVQVKRLIAREHIAAAEAHRRLAAQLPLDEKRRRATWLIDNSGTREETRAQVTALWDVLQREPVRT